ncbi:MAG TPA: AMP-binding protein [Allosphingosinicella sp.]|nr:AMP-binding protein [Allosphingosinicella sp.]
MAESPQRVLVRYLARGEEEKAALTGLEIDDAGRRVAAGLVAAGLAGARALIVMETGPDFIVALLGCLYAGTIAVPAPEPRPGASLDRLASIALACHAAAVIVSDKVAADLHRRGVADGPLAGLRVIEVGGLVAHSPMDDCPGFAHDTSHPAIIQYTSGSTGAPRGIVLDSDCLIANAAACSRALDIGQRNDAQNLCVNWMPHYHDMGLIGKIVTPLLHGYEVVHMSPLAFVQRPARWLQAVSRYGATHSGAPAFALDLCAERVTDAVIEALDLSTWRTVFCGAEPVFATTVDTFRRRFARAGLDPAAVFTCYGLAETTLFAAGTRGPLPAPGYVPGPAERAPCWLDDETGPTIRIVGPDGGVAPDGAEGEIWVSSPSVAKGYLADEAGTRRTFDARLDPDDGRRWLRTGDLGRVDGLRFTVTGRIKDVLIARGVNVAAVDVERFATLGLPHLNGDAAAAFQGPDEAGAPIVLIVEARRSVATQMDEAEVVSLARAAAFERLGVSIAEIHIVPPGTLPRTTSGKIRRAAVRETWSPPQPALVESP